MDWLAAKERGLFFTLNGHPAGTLPHACAALLLAISRGDVCWWALFALVFLVGGRRGRRVALTGALALLLAHAGAWGLRGLVQRAAPIEQYGTAAFVQPGVAPTFSFPWAAAAGAFAALPFLTRGGGVPAGAVWVLAVLLAAVGVYTGAAFPTDVLAGAAVGLASAGTAVWLLGDPFRRRPGPLLPLRRRGKIEPAADPSPVRRRRGARPLRRPARRPRPPGG